MSLALLLALALGAEPAPAVEPPPAPATEAAPAEPVPAEPLAVVPSLPAGTIQIIVTYVQPSGAVVPAQGAQVRIQRLRMPPPMQMDRDPEFTLAVSATTDAAGRANFEPLPVAGIGESDTVNVRWRGVTTSQELNAPNNGVITPLRLVVYDVTRDVSKLEMRVQLTVTPNDKGLRVEHVFALENAAHQAIDTDVGEGLVLPLVTPAPFDEPVASFLPQRPDGDRFFPRVEGDNGRLLVEKGRLVYRGVVQPAGQRLSVMYEIPYADETDHVFGLRMPVAASGLSLTLRGAERVLPEVTLRGASAAFLDWEGTRPTRTAMLDKPPAAGEVVLFDVKGTPDRHTFFRPFAAGVGGCIIAALIVLGAGRKRRPAGRP